MVYLLKKIHDIGILENIQKKDRLRNFGLLFSFHFVSEVFVRFIKPDNHHNYSGMGLFSSLYLMRNFGLPSNDLFCDLDFRHCVILAYLKINSIILIHYLQFEREFMNIKPNLKVKLNKTKTKISKLFCVNLVY